MRWSDDGTRSSFLHVLVEKHPEQQREGVRVEQLVSVGVTGDGQISVHRGLILWMVGLADECPEWRSS